MGCMGGGRRIQRAVLEAHESPTGKGLAFSPEGGSWAAVGLDLFKALRELRRILDQLVLQPEIVIFGVRC